MTNPKRKLVRRAVLIKDKPGDKLSYALVGSPRATEISYSSLTGWSIANVNRILPGERFDLVELV